MFTDLGRTASLLLSAALAVGACGSDPSSNPSSTDLRVAGTYDTVVTLQQNTCTGIIVQRFMTTVTHSAGAPVLTLTHAGNTFTGAVQRNGTFTTTPKVLGGASESNTLTIAGAFTTTAIDATVTIDVQRTGSPNCAYTVKWAGPKQGGPNVIPGN